MRKQAMLTPICSKLRPTHIQTRAASSCAKDKADAALQSTSGRLCDAMQIRALRMGLYTKANVFIDWLAKIPNVLTAWPNGECFLSVASMARQKATTNA